MKLPLPPDLGSGIPQLMSTKRIRRVGEDSTPSMLSCMVSIMSPDNPTPLEGPLGADIRSTSLKDANVNMPACDSPSNSPFQKAPKEMTSIDLDQNIKGSSA